MAQPAEVPGEFTIDELARRAGTTTRNIRAHQSRGLLSPPRLVGRVGYYSQEHLDRLLHIAKLQERGFSLASILDLLNAQEKGLGLTEVLGLEVELTRPWVEEKPDFASEAQVIGDLPEIADDPELVKQGMELGVLEPVDGGFRIPSPRLYRVGVELVRAGLPLKVVFEMGAVLKADMTRIAQRFIDDFTHHIWEPAFSGEYTSADVTKLTETIQRIRPVGAESAQIFLAQAMDELVGQALMQPAPWDNHGEDESSP
jgi:DNA-binding transcriptional MerR regulator